MPNLQIFDRINELNAPKLRSLPYDQYFGEMRGLTKEQKRDRILLAQDIEDAVTMMFYLVMTQSEYAYMAAITSAEIKDRFRAEIEEKIKKYVDVIPDDLREQITEFVDETTDTTTEHLIILNAFDDVPEPDEEKKKAEEFFISNDRIRLLSEEESNSAWGYLDFEKAKREGYTRKRWITMRDSRVRKTHRPLDGETIPIDSLFLVGEGSLMRFARDTSLGASPREIILCRCTVQYLK